MSLGHKFYLFLLTIITLAVLAYLSFHGWNYYQTNLEDRFFHPDYASLKPSGIFGHGYGIIGSLCMLLGVVLYIARKRLRSWSRIGLLKHWLEFHIFLCTVGPILVLYHTTFKFGGLVAVSFWSMVAVFASGVIGRFIYIQIPRTIEGRELSLSEVRDMKSNIGQVLSESYHLDEDSFNLIVESTRKKIEVIDSNIIARYFKKYSADTKAIKAVHSALSKNNLSKSETRELLRLVKHDISLNRRIDRLVTMQNLFKYWHVAHLPFAFVMLIIMVIHVAVTVTFGAHWIF
ncbi:MAG: hypothetical protein HXX13_08475 [Bacteroidetes bacterium]|nr:hypothetical protein [Bacteroidota bacterium]